MDSNYLVTTGMMTGFLLELLSVYFLYQASIKYDSELGRTYLKIGSFLVFVGVSFQFIEEFVEAYWFISTSIAHNKYRTEQLTIAFLLVIIIWIILTVYVQYKKKPSKRNRKIDDFI